MRSRSIIVFVLLALLAACNKGASSGQTATLALKDGTTVSGTVTKSDTASITIQTPNGVVSTYPLGQVSSVNYSASTTASTPAAQQPAGTAPPPSDTSATASTVPPSSTPPSAPAEPDGSYTPAETFVTIPSGTTIAVRTDLTIDSQNASPGQTYPGVVAHDVFDASGQIAIPRGSAATLVIRDARAQGRVEGRSDLAVDVAAVRVQGRRYRLETSDFVERGREGLGANQRTAKFAGGGGLLGTIIGAVAGGGKGAAIGALSGAAAGATAQTVTRGKGVRIPAETVLNFSLEAPIRIREMR